MMGYRVSDLGLSKIDGVGVRLLDFILLVPTRVKRLVVHLTQRISWLFQNPMEFFDFKQHLFWLLEFVFLLLDLLGAAEVYEILCDVVKFNSRPLNSSERALAHSIFGDSIRLRRVRIDEAAFLGPRFFHFAYVGFYTINSWGEMPMALLVHELMHVRQYQHLGAVYIPRALRAQYSDAGYNYGGEAGLQTAIDAKGWEEFNLEQQADIVADYYRLTQGKSPRWITGSHMQLALFEPLMKTLRKG